MQRAIRCERAQKTGISKVGEPRLRALLCMCAAAAVGGDNEFADTCHRLIAAGKRPKAALGAVMRKLLLVMRATVIPLQPCDPHDNRCGRPADDSAQNEAESA